MNANGFGLKEFIIILAVVFIAMIIIMSLSRSIVEDEETNSEPIQEKVTYQELEHQLKKAAERYQNDTYQGNANNKEVWSLSYSMLKEKGYLDKIIDPNDKDIECQGYVEFIQDGAIISYQPYLKCGNNYKTEGYDDNNLE